MSAPPAASEPGPGSAPPAASEPGPGSAPPAEPPFGVPVLAEVPELAGMLEDLRAIDRLVARVIDVLLLVEDTSLAEAATGLPVERWMAAIAGRTRSDRRMLQTAAQACRRLPSMHAAFRAGRISWAQLRVVALRIERLPRDLDDRIDDQLARAVDAAGPHPDPDSLTGVISQVLAAWEPQARGDAGPDTGAPEVDFLAMQPRLDGSGGALYGDFGPAGFAAIDNRLATGPPTASSRDGFAAEPDAERTATTARELAQRRAARLIELCTTQPRGPEDEPQPVPASYVVRADLETLLQLGTERVATLLTTLTDGALRLDAESARALADRHGARLRLVLVDDGRVVGVGRATTRPPGWLTDATLALHDTCSAPGCRVAARVCDTDHARPVSDHGRTDIDNLAPACASHNRAKEAAGWRATQDADGRRRWHHPRSGLVTDTLPATWRPPPARAPTSPDRAPPMQESADLDRAQPTDDPDP